MKVKKQNLEVFFKVLRGTDGVLSLQDARVRDAFMKPLGAAVDTMGAERNKIYDKYCTKDEDGNPDTTDGRYKFEKDIVEEVNAELALFMEEVVDVPYEWGVGATKLKEIVDKSQYKPAYGEAAQIDEIIKEII